MIKFNHILDLVLSSDDSGMIEFWDPETFGIHYCFNKYIDFPCDNKRLTYELPSETDYFDLIKHKTCALSCTFNQSGLIMALYCKDRRIRVFNVRSGELIKTYNETLELY